MIKTKFGSSTSLIWRSILFVTLLTGLLRGQEYRGRVQGTVKDTTEAVIPGATVVLRNLNTGIFASQTTNSTGHYIFDLVEPGYYSITVESAGFSKFVQENVPMGARADITVDAGSKTGDVRETVNGDRRGKPSPV